MKPRAVSATRGAVLTSALALSLSYGTADAQDFIKSSTQSSKFFRLEAHYLHEDEAVDFDIVVGCNIHITNYADNDSSRDVFRDPVVFLKGTRDGSAVMQIVPDACAGETSANGKVPPDFLPGAVWYEDRNDLSLGIAYVTEDAFESPVSELKFLGSTVKRATVDEWVAFQQTPEKNLIDPTQFTLVPRPASKQDVEAYAWDRAKVAEWSRASLRCQAVQRFEISESKARKILAEFWPANRPKFWTVDYTKMPELAAKIGMSGSLKTGERTIAHQFSLDPHTRGFPTRQRGGMFGSGKPRSYLPPVIYPLKSSDGIPWMDAQREPMAPIVQDISLDPKTSLGFAYCYSYYYGPSPLGAFYWPNYFDLKALMRVNGEEVEQAGPLERNKSNLMMIFFEEDQWLYRVVMFGLS